MYKIGIVGDKDSVLGFMALGFTVCVCENSADALTDIKRLAADDYAVIYVTEDMLEELDKTGELDRYKDRLLPAIIAVPPNSGTTGYGLANIKRSVERAVGADILFN